MNVQITLTPAAPGGSIEHVDVVRTLLRLVASAYPMCQVEVADREHDLVLRAPCVAPGSLLGDALPVEALCPCQRGAIHPREGERFCALCQKDDRGRAALVHGAGGAS